MDLVNRTLRWQRVGLSVLLVGAPVGFWRATYDVFNTFKATLIATCVLAMVLIAAYRVSRTRRLELPRSPVVVCAAVLAVAFVVATLVSPQPFLSIVGRPGRHTGLFMYLTYLALFAMCTRLYRDHTPAAVVKTLLGAAVPVTLYGLLQAAGIDPLGWQLVEGGPPVFSTFGNANFYAAFLGVVVPVAVWGALTGTWSTPWRVGSGVLAVAATVGAYASNSQQGPGVAVLGSAFVLAVWVAASPSLARGAKAGLLGGGAVLGVAGVAALAAGVGPLGGLRQSLADSLGTRTPKWGTALDIWRDNPVAGVGLERFADYFFAYRPAWLAAEDGLRRSTDTPHNIPLDMLVNGGALLFLAYVAFVGLTGWALARGLARNSGEDRLLLAGLGGAWLAYQVQSLVSIDVPPVAVLHYVLAGLIVGMGTRPDLWTVTLPGARETTTSTSKSSKAKARVRTPRVAIAPASPVVAGALAVVAVAALVVLTTPVRADLAAARAQQDQGDVEASVAAYDQAAATAFWEARYPALEGAYRTGQEDPEGALAAHLEALEREPRTLSHALNVARLQAALDQDDAADASWERVLEIDPTTPEVLAEAGRYRLSRGDVGGARQLVERAVEMNDDDPAFWVALGQVREASEDVDGARAAFERALELDPEAQGAAAALDALA